MTDQTNDAGQPDAEDTAAVLAQASGDKTYLAPKPEAKLEPDAETDLPGDDAAAEPEAAVKARKTAQDRIDELTRDKHAERRAREAAEQRLAEIEARHAPAAPHTPEPNEGKPDPEKFEGGVYDPLYVEALTDWKAEQAVSRLITAREAQSQVKTAVEKFEERVKAQYPDGEPAGIAALRRLPTIAPTMLDLITGSDTGPKIADHLGSNLGEFQRISALAPHMQGAEIARLEQRLATPAAPTPKLATDAPEPAPTVRGAGGRFKVAADTQDFAAFEKQYVGGS